MAHSVNDSTTKTKAYNTKNNTFEDKQEIIICTVNTQNEL